MRPVTVLPALAIMLATSLAAADGSYGRLDGDLTFVGGVGGSVVAHDGSALASGDLRLRYLDAAGASVSYEEGLSRTGGFGSLRRAFLAGVEFRPLFPIRFLKAKQTGEGFFDLTLDSLSLDVGAWLPQRMGSASRRFGMYAGIAVELPLFARASGLWVRLSSQLRWAPQRLEGDDDPSGRSVVFGLGLAWHQVFGAGLVQKGDEPPR
jgi:hypothetical protein